MSNGPVAYVARLGVDYVVFSRRKLLDLSPGAQGLAEPRGLAEPGSRDPPGKLDADTERSCLNNTITIANF